MRGLQCRPHPQESAGPGGSTPAQGQCWNTILVASVWHDCVHEEDLSADCIDWLEVRITLSSMVAGLLGHRRAFP
jgi:hypothetical protein